MTTRDILVQLRALLDHPAHWTQYQMARNANNYPVGPTKDEAEKWCLLGGLCKVTGDASGLSVDYADARNTICIGLTGVFRTPAAFNDSSTHAEVLAAIDVAIEKC